MAEKDGILLNKPVGARQVIQESDEERLLARVPGFVRIRFLGPDALPDQRALSLVQVHGTEVLCSSQVLSSQAGSRPRADGMYTRRSGELLCVRTADCLPVVLWSCRKDFLAVLHAGWRGLFGGILAEAVSCYESLGGRSCDLSMVCGPCLSKEHFEVGPELIEALRKMPLGEDEISAVASRGRGDRWHIDLALVSVLCGLRLGLKPEGMLIFRSCTFSNASRWNSYRRTGHALPSNDTTAELRLC